MTKIIQRHDTSTNWTSVNPVLALGEMGIETDTNKFKFGDGVTEWTSLDYASAEGGGSADLSDYYTKEETYNQEEVDNLLDEKQNVFTTNIPLELSQTTYSNQNKMYYSDGTASVTSNTYSAKYYNRFSYSQIMSVGATASVDLKVYTCTIGSGSAPSNYQTISRDGDVNYISYPFSFTTGKEIIFPANYTLGYFDVDGVFNSIITNYYGSGSTGSINYWYTMMATDVNGVKHDSSVTTGQYKVIGRATGNNAGITPLASAEKVAYSLSCPS